MRYGIRTRAVFWLALVGVLLAAGAYPFGKRVLDTTFREFEQQQIAGDLERAAWAIREDAERLRVLAHNYSHWDEAFAYVANPSPEFITANFSPEVLLNVRADFALIADAERTILWSGAVDGDEIVLGPLDETLKRTATDRSIMLEGTRPLESIWRVAWIGDQGVMLAVSPVSDTPREAFAGWLVFGKWLNVAHRETLKTRTGGTFSLAPAPSATESTSSDSEVVIDDDHFRASKTIFEGSTAVLRIESHGLRPLAQQQTRATQLLLWSVALTIIIGLLLTYFLMHRLVIRRLSALGAWAQARRDQPDLARSESTSNDEIDGLRIDFEALTQDLEQVTHRWKKQAREDWLTGIGNRAQLFADLEAAKGDDVLTLALLLIDLDHFKAVNDLTGHQSGDELLSEVAKELAKRMPPGAAVYRIGGDEFAVLWRNYSSSEAIDDLAAELLNAVRSQRCAVGVSASIGIVENMREAEVPKDFLMHADVALYAAKQSGRGIAHRFTAQDLTQFREHFELTNLLQEALDGGHIEVHFQPIVCAKTHRVVATEALARWTHDGAVVSPARFVAVAERSNLINALDAYVLQRSCEALVRLQASTPGLCINVNVSPLSLQDDTFLAALTSTLANTAVKTEFLRIELTEGGAGLHSNVLEAAATALRAANVALVIDDFGAGASSLSRLNRLHPQGLKLDGSFVLDYRGDGGRICRAVVELARELELDLTAECVESAEQAAFLSGIGCPMQQGFFYSPALSETALIEWINAFHCSPAPSDA